MKKKVTGQLLVNLSKVKNDNVCFDGTCKCMFRNTLYLGTEDPFIYPHLIDPVYHEHTNWKIFEESNKRFQKCRNIKIVVTYSQSQRSVGTSKSVLILVSVSKIKFCKVFHISPREIPKLNLKGLLIIIPCEKFTIDVGILKGLFSW